VRWPGRLALSSGALAAAVALAGPPLITDDPDTPGRNHWEINIAYTLDVSARMGSAGRTWEHNVPLLDLNYGLFENDQIKLEVPLVILDPAGQGARAGVGDALLGYKFRFIDEDKAPLSLSVYPQLGIPSGDESRGLGTGSPSLKLPMQIGRHLLDDKLFLYGDFGYDEQFARREPDSWFAGVAAEYAVTDRLTLCGELRCEHMFHGESGTFNDGLINVGAKWKLGESASIIGAIGRSFDPRPQAGADLIAYLGTQLRF
jgi:hypothetical protein